uniref:Transport permease protein n=1 Tax=Desulfatirhabdium butyrativorans TaxID=340467 RepID=A0A7C4W1P4_9BACT
MNFIMPWLLAPFRHTTLFVGFIRQEIRGRYAGSIGGLLWSVITPLTNMIVYIFVFAVVFKIRLQPMETGTDNFVLFLLSGLLPWMAFSESVGNSSGMFVGKANLITKVAFPLEVVPLAAVSVTFILSGVGFIIFLGYLVLLGYAHVMWLWLFPVTGLFMLFTLGLVLLVGSLSVFVRDIQQMIGIVLSLWMYLSPVVYPVSMLSERLRMLMRINPMFHFVELYHEVLLRHQLPMSFLGMAAGFSVISFMAGAWFYGKSRNAFADVL